MGLSLGLHVRPLCAPPYGAAQFRRNGMCGSGRTDGGSRRSAELFCKDLPVGCMTTARSRLEPEPVEHGSVAAGHSAAARRFRWPVRPAAGGRIPS